MKIQAKIVLNNRPNEDGRWVELEVPAKSEWPNTCHYDYLTMFAPGGFHVVQVALTQTIEEPEAKARAR